MGRNKAELTKMQKIALEQVACGICGATENRFLFTTKDYIYFQPGTWPVAQCTNCGVVFMNPRIPPAEIGNFYPQDYYTNQVNTQRRWSWGRNVKDAAIQKYFGYSLVKSDSAFLNLVGQALLPFTKRWTETTKYITAVSNGKVLDVGCGNGQRLSEYKRLGWHTVGVEVGLASANLARASGHEVFVGELVDANFSTNEFDAITLWDSLEHIHNPSQVMREVYRVTKIGGKVYIAVPNFGSWYARLFRDRWFMFTAPLHYYHYTKETLTFLLQESGFENIRISYPLGDAGFTSTMNAICHNNKIILATLQFFPFRVALKLIDFVMPNGHLLAIAEKRK